MDAKAPVQHPVCRPEGVLQDRGPLLRPGGLLVAFPFPLRQYIADKESYLLI